MRSHLIRFGDLNNDSTVVAQLINNLYYPKLSVFYWKWMYYRVCSNVFLWKIDNVWFQKISTDWNSERYGSVRGKFLQGREVQIELNSFQWIWNVIEWTLSYFPINSGNQTNTNTLPAEISIYVVFVMSFFVFAPILDDADGTPEHHVCCMPSQTRCQIKGEVHVQQYLNNEVNDILYFEDRAVFSLNAARAFCSSCSQMRFILCIFNFIYSYKIIPLFGLVVTTLSHIFIIIQHVVNSLLAWTIQFNAICLEVHVHVTDGS